MSGLSIYFLYGLRHSLVGLETKIRSRVDLKPHPLVLAKDFHEFEYDMDVIPAHRDLSHGKQSPLSPIFWKSLQNYNFLGKDYHHNNDNDNDDDDDDESEEKEQHLF